MLLQLLTLTIAPLTFSCSNHEVLLSEPSKNQGVE